MSVPKLAPWRAEAYLVLSVLLLITGLVTSRPDRFPLPSLCVAIGIGCDGLLYSTATVFGTQKPRNVLRVALFTFLSYLQLVVAFAIAYRTLPSGELCAHSTAAEVLSVGHALYFSVITIATVGFGDIVPAWNNGSAGLAVAIVSLEVLAGLYFLAVLMAIIIGWAGPSSGLPTVSMLEEESERLERNALRFHSEP